MRRAIETMGTVFSVEAAPCPPALLAEVEAEWHRIDADYSPFRPTSLVSRCVRGELGVDQAGPEFAAVLAACDDLTKRTGGLFDAYGSGRLDPSGYVKGWAIARGAAQLVAGGARSVCVNGGGDVQTHGLSPDGTPWRVGIAHPRRAGRLALVVAAPDERPFAVATSGTYERGQHVLSPLRCGLAVSVIGRDIAEADAVATAALAAGDGARDLIEGWPGLEALGFDSDGSVWWTGGMSRFAPLPPAQRAS